jgi:HSP20 family protein
MRIPKFFQMATIVSILGLSPLQAAHAADQNDDLKAQVKTLNDRINQLEQQLAQKNNPAAPQGFSSTAVDQWDPFLEMQRMRAQMNQLFQDSFDRGFGPGSSALSGPQADVKETPDHYIVTMDLPGMDKDKINVEVKNGMLVVSGDRSEEKQVNGGQFYRQERSVGHFLRTIPLPNGAKPDDVKADYANGVLEVKIGRVAGSKPGSDREGKRIQVN